MLLVALDGRSSPGVLTYLSTPALDESDWCVNIMLHDPNPPFASPQLGIVARVFVTPNFSANSCTPMLLAAAADDLPDHVWVLLEFISPGPNGRQVDLAILGPYGIDVIEVKCVRGGTVIVSDHGEWTVRKDGGGTYKIPLNEFRGRQENPWDQADNTAKDFEKGLRSQFNGAVWEKLKVFPAVLVPEGRPQAYLGSRQFVNGMNGVDELVPRSRSLRSYRESSEVWGPDEWFRLVEDRGLVELGRTDITVGGRGTPSGDDDKIPADAPWPTPQPTPQPTPRPAGDRPWLIWGGVLLLVALLLYIGWRQVGAPDQAPPTGFRTCPLSNPIKGNESSMIYHMPGQEFYAATHPEVCFRTEASARAAGFRRSLR